MCAAIGLDEIRHIRLKKNASFSRKPRSTESAKKRVLGRSLSTHSTGTFHLLRAILGGIEHCCAPAMRLISVTIDHHHRVGITFCPSQTEIRLLSSSQQTSELLYYHNCEISSIIQQSLGKNKRFERKRYNINHDGWNKANVGGGEAQGHLGVRPSGGSVSQFRFLLLCPRQVCDDSPTH